MIGFFFQYVYKRLVLRGAWDWESFSLGIDFYGSTNFYLHAGWFWINLHYVRKPGAGYTDYVPKTEGFKWERDGKRVDSLFGAKKQSNTEIIERIEKAKADSDNLQHIRDRDDKPVYLFYSPELDMIVEGFREDGYMFKDEEGDFHLKYNLDTNKAFKNYKFYVIGEL